ncbi:hypothetical protein [Sphaerisporangium sp. NPDC051011]|uniref:hypothetical protein n=1 Tax=Sphaerisporangium sp. NPDC051011 TaxID=3155792 RepID=UPI0033FF0D14
MARYRAAEAAGLHGFPEEDEPLTTPEDVAGSHCAPAGGLDPARAAEQESRAALAGEQ